MNESRLAAADAAFALCNKSPELFKLLQTLVIRRWSKADILDLLRSSETTIDWFIAERETTKPDPNQRKPRAIRGFTVRWCPRCGPAILLTSRVLARTVGCDRCAQSTIPWTRRHEEPA